jgi:CheY-like chemotaxis protein
MIVEDDESLMSIFKMSLELDGYQIIEATNGKVALDKLLALDSTQMPDCIVLDIMMPVMDGHTFLKIISNSFEKKISNIPVIVCSAHGKHEMTSQVVAKLIKPIALEDLCETVGKFLKGKPVFRNSQLVTSPY